MIRQIARQLVSRACYGKAAIRLLVVQNTLARSFVLPRAVRRPIQRLLLVPSERRTLTGSLGDDAMLSAVVSLARARNSDIEIDVVTSASGAETVARARQLTPVDLWGRSDFAFAAAKLLRARAYDAAVVVGADVIDGVYYAVDAAKMLVLADLAAYAGVPTTMLGFSFSITPAVELARLFNRLDGRVQLNLRDEDSLARFQKFSTAKARLVADAAFLLEPGVVDDATLQWIKARRREGRKVLGFNLHPGLFTGSGDGDSAIVAAAEAMTQATRARGIAWLLLSHDYRERSGDPAFLGPVANRIKPLLGDCVRTFDGVHPASTLKAVVGHLDGVVSGRMHLAIAALGMSVPVLAIVYRDKFEGLFRHFDLPVEFLLSPATVPQGALAPVLVRFAVALNGLREKVAAGLPRVLDLARDNFLVFD